MAQRDAAVVERHRVIPADPAAKTAEFVDHAATKPGVLERAAGETHGSNTVPPAELVGKTDGR